MARPISGRSTESIGMLVGSCEVWVTEPTVVPSPTSTTSQFGRDVKYVQLPSHRRGSCVTPPPMLPLSAARPLRSQLTEDSCDDSAVQLNDNKRAQPSIRWLLLGVLLLLAVALATVCVRTARWRARQPPLDGSASSLPLPLFESAPPSEALAMDTNGVQGPTIVTAIEDSHTWTVRSVHPESPARRVLTGLKQLQPDVQREVAERVQTLQQEQPCNTSRHTFSPLSSSDSDDGPIGCAFSEDNRDWQPYFTEPYGWTVYLRTYWGTNGEITNDGSGFIMRDLAPLPYVVILTAGHNIIESKNGLEPFAIDFWVMGSGLTYTVDQNNLAYGCAWSASEGWDALNLPKDATANLVKGVDWGYLICDPSLFSPDPFPASTAGFGLLADNSVYEQLLNEPVPAIHAGFPSDKMALPPTDQEVWSVAASHYRHCLHCLRLR